jgi:PAS domain S-box-containing protein
MNRFRNQPIKTKLVVIIMTASIIAIISGLAIYLIFDMNSIKNEMKKNADLNASLVGQYSVVPLIFDYKNEAKDVLAKLNTMPSVLDACIYNANGEIFSFYHKITDSSFKFPKPEGKKTGFSDGYLHVYYNILFEGKNYGILYLRLSTVTIKEKLRNNLLVMFVLILILVIPVYLIAYRLQKFISEPILNLAELAKTISQNQDYSVQLKPYGNDEIGILYRQFNNFLSQILKRQKERDLAEEKLKTLNEQLKKELIERSQIEESMRLSEERYRYLFERNPAPMAIYDPVSLDLLAGNEAFFNLYGYLPEEVPSLHLPDFYPDDEKEAIVDLVRGLKGHKYTGEWHHVKKDGSVFPIITTSHDLVYMGKKTRIVVITDITERKKAEEEALFLAQVLRNINEFVSITDENNKITFVNQSWLKAFGYTEKEIIGENIGIVVSQSNRAGIAGEILSTTLKGGWKGEVINRRKDGSEFPVRLVTTIIYDKEEKPVALVGISSDITEQKKAEEALKESEAKLRSLMENSADAIFLTDHLGNFTYTNKAVSNLLGFSFEEMKTKKIGDFSPKDKKDETLKKFNQLLIDGKLFIELDLIKKNGDTISCDLNSVLLPGGLFYGSFRDITERKKEQKELLKHRDHLEQLVSERTDELRSIMSEMQDLYDNAPCGYHSLNEHSIFVRINNTELKWLGYSREEVINKMKKSDIMTPESRERFKKDFSEFLKKGEINNVEYEYIRKDGTTFFGSFNATSILDQNGKFLMTRSTLFDITERKRIEVALSKAIEESENANKAKSEFLANMSHEIRTPMNAVLGYTELLSSLVTEQTQKNYIESIKSSGRSLLTLINDILDLSKIEAGKLELEYDYVESSFFFTEFERIFALKAAEKGIKFIVEIQSGTPSGLYIDEPRLRQIIFNLIGNAIKFTHQGTVKLKVHTDNIQVMNYGNEKSEEYLDLLIEVEDTGIGISKEIMEEIFDPFIQARDQKNIGGTGLGLAITRRLTSLMKGTINLKSELGKGSTFTVKIPEIAFKREFINSKITIQVNPSDLIFDPCTILVVDDVEHNRSFIRDTLRNTSITVIEADEGFKALKLAKKVIPTLIISDIRMPNMDGFELLSKLKANKKLKHIPVLAYSASVLKDQKERIHKSQFVGLLTKPVNITELFLELMNHLPYKEAIKKKTDQTTDISKSEIKDLKSLISSLESDFMEVWKNFEIRQPIGEIKKFGEDLIRLGTDHNSNLVKKYGNDLLTAGESFNIEAILILLKQYSVNLENLKTLV